MDSDIQEIKSDVKQLLITSAKHQVLLDEHMARTQAAERTLAILESRTSTIEKRFFKIDGATKLLGILLGSITLIDVVLKIFEHINLLR